MVDHGPVAFVASVEIDIQQIGRIEVDQTLDQKRRILVVDLQTHVVQDRSSERHSSRVGNPKRVFLGSRGIEQCHLTCLKRPRTGGIMLDVGP